MLFEMSLATLASVVDKLFTVGTADALGADSSMGSQCDSETAGSIWAGISLPAQGGGMALRKLC